LPPPPLPPWDWGDRLGPNCCCRPPPNKWTPSRQRGKLQRGNIKEYIMIIKMPFLH
jgi:hypothetical protein